MTRGLADNPPLKLSCPMLNYTNVKTFIVRAYIFKKNLVSCGVISQHFS